jgi:glyoxylase-like metal-dependent hydrolase (beta-lactamase superfamily II)
MILKMLETGPLAVNCYIVGDEESSEAVVFDPGGDADKILQVLGDNDLEVKYIVNTHCHWDHVGGNQDLQEATGAPILVHREESAGLGNVANRAGHWGFSGKNSKASQFLEAGDWLEVGAIRFHVIDLRGHSPGGLGFVFEGELVIDRNRETRKLVICGDALFAGSIGRTDFPGGDMDRLLTNIRDNIFTLPEDTLVLPGHGPVSTVGHEKKNNPFFL